MSQFHHGLAQAADVASTTAIIQQAIDAAGNQGGGAVVLPAGTWVCTTLFLRSGVTLRLDRGCVLQAHTDLSMYPEMKVGIIKTEQGFIFWSPKIFAT